jgi:DNA-binding NtrC family response regulator
VDYAPRILIVDDEVDVRILFAEILSEDGYYVTGVGTVREARRELCDRIFEVVVVDLSLPDGDGIELVREMRSESAYLKILATSGFLVGNMPELVIAAGASATLQKPSTPRKFQDAVYRLLAEPEMCPNGASA